MVCFLHGAIQLLTIVYCSKECLNFEFLGQSFFSLML
uniref:Uncharacterized protein n=1 Tax=Arundo donax TaxID=35708 RepID=A0A0A8ZMQ5_ARUDO